MKLKNKLLFLSLISLVSLTPIFLSAQCELTIHNKNKNSYNYNEDYTLEIEDLEDFIENIQEVNDKLLFSNESGEAFVTSESEDDTQDKVNSLYQIMRGFLSKHQISSSNLDENNLISSIDSMNNKYESEITKLNLKNGMFLDKNNEFYKSLKKLEQLGCDLSSQISTDIDRWNNFVLDPVDGNTESSRLGRNILLYLKDNKVPENADILDAFINDYQMVWACLASWHSSTWKEKEDVDFNSLFNPEGVLVHKHSHALGNMIHEVINTLYYFRNEVKPSPCPYKENYNNFKKELLSSALADNIKNEYKDLFKQLDNFFTIDLKQAYDYAESLRDSAIDLKNEIANLVTKYYASKNIVQVKDLPEPKLADEK